MPGKSGFVLYRAGGYRGHASISDKDPYSCQQIPAPIPVYARTMSRPRQTTGESSSSSSMIKNQPSSSYRSPYVSTDDSQLLDVASSTADRSRDGVWGQAPRTSRVSFAPEATWVPEGYQATYFGPRVPRSSIPHTDYNPQRPFEDHSSRPRLPPRAITASSAPVQPAMHQSQYATQPHFLASARWAPPPMTHEQPWSTEPAWHQQVPPTKLLYQWSMPMGTQSVHPGHTFLVFQQMPATSLCDTIGLTSINVLIDEQVGHDPTKPLPNHIKSAKLAAPAQYNRRDDNTAFHVWLSGVLTYCCRLHITGRKLDPDRLNVLGTTLSGGATDWYYQNLVSPYHIQQYWMFKHTVNVLYQHFIITDAFQQATNQFYNV